MSDQEGMDASSSSPVHIQNWSRWAVVAGLGIVSLYLIFRLQQIFLLFYLATLFGLAINPIIVWFERRHIARPLAVAGLALLLIGGVVTTGILIVPPAADQAQALSDNFPRYYSQTQTFIQHTVHRYPALEQRLTEQGDFIKNNVSKAGVVLGHLGEWALGLGGLIFSGFLVFFLVLFGLMDPKPMASALFDLTPAAFHERLERTLANIQEKVVAWVVGTFILMAIIGVVVWIGLTVMGAPQALLFGIIAAIGEAIPNIGPVLSAIPPVVLMLLTDPVKALYVIALFVVVQQLENNIIVPFVMGNRLNVHPWALIFMILVMGELFGLPGVFLATPTAAILGVIYTELIPKPGQKDSVPTIHRVARVIGGIKGEIGDNDY